MKSIKFLFFILLLSLLVASENKSNYITRLKTLTEVIRLVSEHYVDEPDMNEVLEGAIIGMLEKLDPHSTYLTSDLLTQMQENFQGEFEGIGIEFSIIDGYITVISPIPDTPSDRAGLISGDKIIKIDDESAYKITQEDVFDKLRGPKNSKVNLTIRRANVEDFDVTLFRDKIPIHSVLASFMIDDETGYIKINRFSHTTFSEFNESLHKLESEGMKQLLLDLRNNPGGLMNQAVDMVDMFINSKDTIVFTKGRIRGVSRSERATRSYKDKKYPIVTLINRGSASASEIVSGAFQDLDRGIIVGETSFGKGSVQNLLQLHDGSAVKLTVAKYYTPSGRSIHRSHDSGIDEYYLDLARDNREDIQTDSTNNKPIFYTKSGREVYGGGGITPDIYVDSDLNLSKSSSEFLIHPDRLLFNFSDQIKNELDDKFKSIDDFIENYYLSESHKSDLKIILQDLDDSFSNEDFDSDWNYLENRIKAQVANALWGKSAMYKVHLNMDQIALEGMKQFKLAKDLLIK